VTKRKSGENYHFSCLERETVFGVHQIIDQNASGHEICFKKYSSESSAQLRLSYIKSTNRYAVA